MLYIEEFQLICACEVPAYSAYIKFQLICVCRVPADSCDYCGVSPCDWIDSKVVAIIRGGSPVYGLRNCVKQLLVRWRDSVAVAVTAEVL